MADILKNLHFKAAFSLVEILFALLIISIIGVGMLYSILALKRHDIAAQKALLHNSSLYETSIFINKYLAFAKLDSIKVTPNSLSWQGYDKLFLNTQNTEFMDYSLDTTKYEITLKNNNLYINGALLLQNVRSFTPNLKNDILTYTLCSHICISDYILLDNIEVDF